MYYFLKTYAEGSTNRLRALPNQQFKNGAEIPVTLNIQASQTIRQRCPIGTIFACAGLEVRGGEGTKYLSAIGQIVPMTYELSGIKRTREMQQAFDEDKTDLLSEEVHSLCPRLTIVSVRILFVSAFVKPDEQHRW